MKRICWAVYVCGVCLSLWMPTDAMARPLKLVVSMRPIGLVLLNVTGAEADIEVSSLPGLPGGCAHGYHLCADDLKRLSRADALIIGGGGLESFVNDVRRALPALAIMDASAGSAQTLAHGWMEPGVVVAQARAMARQLGALDPPRAELFIRNAETYAARVSDFTARARDRLRDLPPGRVVTLFEGFAALSAWLPAHVVITNVDENEHAVLPRTLTRALRENEEPRCSALLVSAQTAPALVAMVQRECKAPVIQLDAMLEGSLTADAWLESMRANVHLLSRVLKP